MEEKKSKTTTRKKTAKKKPAVKKTTTRKKPATKKKATSKKTAVKKKITTKKAKPTKKVKAKSSSKKKPAKKKTTTKKKTAAKKKPTVKKAVPFKSPKVVVPSTITAEIESNDFNEKEIKVKPIKESPPVFNVVFSLALLTIVSFLIGFIVINKYSTTVTEVNDNVVTSALIAPAELLEESFYTKAGKVTTQYPEAWEINTRSNNSIGFKPVASSNAQVTIKIENATAATPLEWIKESPPDYSSYNVLDTPDYLEKKSGLLLSGYNEKSNPVMAAYYIDKYYMVWNDSGGRCQFD